jgi:hypothetical protein
VELTETVRDVAPENGAARRSHPGDRTSSTRRASSNRGSSPDGSEVRRPCGPASRNRGHQLRRTVEGGSETSRRWCSPASVAKHA